MHDNSLRAHASMRRLSLALLLAILLLSGCMAGMSQPSTSTTSATVTRPEQLDASARQTSAQGRFVVSYRGEAGAPAINQVQTWIVRVETPDGKPVDNAQVSVTGGMPEHNHGLPTVPQVTAAGSGEYRVEGMKFHMPGWWTVTVQVANGGQQDSATFNLLLE